MKEKLLTHGTRATLIKRQNSGHYQYKQFDIIADLVPEFYQSAPVDKMVKIAGFNTRAELRGIF
jgi:hypothetical protein